jgi:hypothetical protein
MLSYQFQFVENRKHTHGAKLMSQAMRHILSTRMNGIPRRLTAQFKIVLQQRKKITPIFEKITSTFEHSKTIAPTFEKITPTFEKIN